MYKLSRKRLVSSSSAEDNYSLNVTGKRKQNVTRNRLFPSSSDEDNNSSNVPGKRKHKLTKKRLFSCPSGEDKSASDVAELKTEEDDVIGDIDEGVQHSKSKTKENVTRNRLFPRSSEEDNNSSNVPGKRKRKLTKKRLFPCPSAKIKVRQMWQRLYDVLKKVNSTEECMTKNKPAFTVAFWCLKLQDIMSSSTWLKKKLPLPFPSTRGRHRGKNISRNCGY
ncbi:uncharacterized protein [Acropora muricata]|uniref:uncharacterized protein isoform X1 n=1 Tax=Acropora muricata TaxID=159855 RepID=UPI0034E46059